MCTFNRSNRKTTGHHLNRMKRNLTEGGLLFCTNNKIFLQCVPETFYFLLISRCFGVVARSPVHGARVHTSHEYGVVGGARYIHK